MQIHHGGNQLAAFFGNLRSHLFQRLTVSLENFGYHCFDITAFKRTPSAEHVIHRGAQRINISPGIHIVRGKKLFGGCVVDCSGDPAAGSGGFIFACLGNSQICKFDFIVGGDENVGRLDIPVDYIKGCCRCQSLTDAPCHLENIFFAHGTFADNVFNVPAFHIFHNDVTEFAHRIHLNIHDIHNVRGVDPACQAGFVDKGIQ